MSEPKMKFRAGSVSSALWENEVRINGDSVVLLKASIERSYKGKDGQWKTSTSFGRNEIPLAIFCLQKAFEAIIEREQASSVRTESVR